LRTFIKNVKSLVPKWVPGFKEPSKKLDLKFPAPASQSVKLKILEQKENENQKDK